MPPHGLNCQNDATPVIVRIRSKPSTRLLIDRSTVLAPVTRNHANVCSPASGENPRALTPDWSPGDPAGLANV